MTRDQVVAFAKVLGLKGIDAKTRKGWVLCKCPFASYRHEGGKDANPSAGIHYGKDTYFNCFSCDMHGDLESILYRLGVYALKSDAAQLKIKDARYYLETDGKALLMIGKDEEEEDQDEIIPFPEWYISGYEPAYAHPYLASRKGGPVPYSIAKKMDFRLDAKRQRLGVPIRDFEGELMGFHGRTVNNSKLPYLAYTYHEHWNRPVWSGENRITFDRPLVMVESIFDEARVLQVYPNVCSPLSASLNAVKIKRMGGALRIIELFDADAAGRKAAEKIRSFLPDSVIDRAYLPEGFGDPGETPPELIHDVLKPLCAVHAPIYK